MTRLAGPLCVVGVVLLAIFFASQNGAERVTIDLGIVILRGVPITVVAFGGLLVGMLVMLGAGIQSDLKVRAILRQRLAEQSGEDGDYVDTAQRDLFLHPPSEEHRPVHRIPDESRAAAPPAPAIPEAPRDPARPSPSTADESRRAAPPRPPEEPRASEPPRATEPPSPAVRDPDPGAPMD